RPVPLKCNCGRALESPRVPSPSSADGTSATVAALLLLLLLLLLSGSLAQRATTAHFGGNGFQAFGFVGGCWVGNDAVDQGRIGLGLSGHRQGTGRRRRSVPTTRGRRRLELERQGAPAVHDLNRARLGIKTLEPHPGAFAPHGQPDASPAGRIEEAIAGVVPGAHVSAELQRRILGHLGGRARRIRRQERGPPCLGRGSRDNARPGKDEGKEGARSHYRETQCRQRAGSSSRKHRRVLESGALAACPRVSRPRTLAILFMDTLPLWAWIG